MYSIQLTDKVAKEIAAIPAKQRMAIMRKIAGLTINPRPAGCLKLAGSSHDYRLRQGNYRIVYAVYDKLVVVELIKVQLRKDVYK